jgi:hypothetical protein
MYYLQRGIFAERSEPDDIDKLFNRLEPLEPPSDLIARILNSISRLSPRSLEPESPWDNDSHVDGLVVRNEKSEPS